MRRKLNIAAFTTLALIAALGVSGCGKKAPQAAPQPAPAAAPSAAQPAPQAQSSAQPAAQQAGEPDLGNINRTLIRWLIHNKRRPANFEDFAATADTPIPPAPPGKKYVIAANMHVQLVNQ
jgi:hypothetical protein